MIVASRIGSRSGIEKRERWIIPIQLFFATQPFSQPVKKIRIDDTTLLIPTLLLIRVAMELPRTPAESRKEEIMKEQALRIIATLGFLLLLTSISVSAQTEPGIRSIQIPFSFTAGEKRLPAGEYSVERLRADAELVWLIRGRQGCGSAMILTMAVRRPEGQAEAKLVFHRYGEEYFLAQIWPGGEEAGRELRIERREHEVAQHGVKQQLEEVAARRE